MTLAATTFPFMNQNTNDAPWIVWTKTEPVFNLVAAKQTDGRFENDNAEHIKTDESIHPFATSFQMQTNRYHSVLARMDQAKKMTSKFSTWGS